MIGDKQYLVISNWYLAAIIEPQVFVAGASRIADAKNECVQQKCQAKYQVLNTNY